MRIGEPFISIIIPTYRRPDSLQVCLRALSKLDYPKSSFEVIIVDDGGEIPLQPLLEPFSERLRMKVLRQPNAGPAAARNFGASGATGALLAFTDDDCAPASNWLRTFAAAFLETPISLLGGRTLNALRDNPYAGTSQLIIDVAYAHYNRYASDAQFFASNNMAAPTDLFRSLNGFDPKFRTSEDRDLCDRWRSSGHPLRYVPEAVISHAHTLTLRSFWNQHAGYGRGAWLYHRARAHRGTGRFRPDWIFYRDLLCAPFMKGLTRHLLRDLSLLLTAQSANALGCFEQALMERFGRDSTSRSHRSERFPCGK